MCERLLDLYYFPRIYSFSHFLIYSDTHPLLTDKITKHLIKSYTTPTVDIATGKKCIDRCDKRLASATIYNSLLELKEFRVILTLFHCTVSTAQIIQSRMKWGDHHVCVSRKELRRRRSWPICRYYPNISLEKIRKFTRNVDEDGRLPSQHSKCVPPPPKTSLIY